MQTTELVERGRDAFDRHIWPDAYAQLAEADSAHRLQPADLERLATAAYLIGRDDDSRDAWSRAHGAWRDAGDVRRSIRCAFWLGFGLVQRGEVAQGGGWLARAGRLVEEHQLDTVERGYLLVPAGLMAMGQGDFTGALEIFSEAGSVGRRFDDADLATLGLLGRGEALVRSGETSAGLALFDEAMVAVTAGETSPTISGLVYCAVIDGCHSVFDLQRAREWTAALDRWCERQPGLVPYRGQCLVHRAQVLQVRGEWEAAALEADQACRWLSEPPHPAVGMAHYERGELHRLRGELDEAEAAYRAAHTAGRDPQPGLALLRLAQGATASAATAVRTALGAAGDRRERMRLLPAHVEIMLAAGELDAAAAAADELGSLADQGATALVAVAAQARGSVLLARGEPEAALEQLHLALASWQALPAPFELSRVRVLLAQACRQLGDGDGAALELEAAQAGFAALGAAPWTPAPLEPPPDEHAAGEEGQGADGLHGPVTDREREVLRLVAAGHSNREIARELAVSEKTVERHLGNVFTKLAVPNRAAATAYAYEHGLL